MSRNTRERGKNEDEIESNKNIGKASLQTLTVTFAFSILLRILVGNWGYSGYGKPPMYGDFEAQRHWLEVIINLPLGDWYRNTADNDLLYWGLDYPPLTAYVSWVFGSISNWLYPELVALHSSRGHESVPGKWFMRLTVLLMDLLILFPSLFMCVKHFVGLMKADNNLKSLQAQSSKSDNRNEVHEIIHEVKKDSHLLSGMILACLLCPALLLIDHGHFQYNGTCIGLAIWGATFILEGQDLIGSILFCLSLNFKQMALYYSPVFFFVLLRKCITKFTSKSSYSSSGIIHLAKIGSTVIFSFAALWLPFCILHAPSETCTSSLLHVLTRQFPFSRGIFEDKVANIWYLISRVVDVREIFATETLAYYSTKLTLLLLAPMATNIMMKKQVCGIRFILALLNSSLAFFLASFQVHEKSLLLALVPASLLLPFEPLLIGWFQIIGVWTMFPLLVKDGLRIPYFAVCVLYMTYLYFMTRSDSAALIRGNESTRMPHIPRWAKVVFVTLSLLGACILHVLEATVNPPSNYPHIYPALFSIYGALNLVACYLLCTYWQVFLSDTIQTEESSVVGGSARNVNTRKSKTS